MYKGSSALLAHALLTAHAHGVLPQVLDDLGDSFPRQIDRAARMLAVSATKADRYVGEMREIAATQASAGLTPALFEAMAEVYEAVARSPIAAEAPEAIAAEPDLEDVLGGIAPTRHTEPDQCDRPARAATVRARGLEPPRAEAHRDLNPARLPVPPRPRSPTRIGRGSGMPLAD